MAQQIQMTDFLSPDPDSLLNVLRSRLAHRERRAEYRARFDINRSVQDLMKAKRLRIGGEGELKTAMN